MSTENQVQKQNSQASQPARKSTTKSRFSKYKPMIEEAHNYESSVKLEQIFESMCYTPLVPDSSGLKDSTSTAVDRMSTFQSQADQGIDLTSSQVLVPVPPATVLNQAPNPNTPPAPNSQIPPYLQQFNRLNSITPNFLHPKFNIKQQLVNFNYLIKVAINAIHHVFGCALRVGDKGQQIRVFSQDAVQGMDLKFFMFSGWERVKVDPYIERIRPRRNFEATLDFNQILHELDLILSKTSRYELAASLTQQIQLQTYTKMRENLFEVQQRLLECSNSIYKLWNTNEYPYFYYTYLKILRNEGTFSKLDLEITVKEFRKLWEIHEPLTCSEIGRAVWDRLHKLSV